MRYTKILIYVLASIILCGCVNSVDTSSDKTEKIIESDAAEAELPMTKEEKK